MRGEITIQQRGYQFTGEFRPGGSVYLTCQRLPGFRLLVHSNENMDAAIDRALDVFLPIFLEAQSRT